MTRSGLPASLRYAELINNTLLILRTASFFFFRHEKKRKKDRQASNSESATMLFYFKSRLPAISRAGRGGGHWVSPPPPARPPWCACACVHLLFYPHVTFQPVPLALPPSPKSLINRFACFLYPHMWRIWSKACLRFLVVVFFISLSIYTSAFLCVCVRGLFFFFTLLATAMATVTCLAKSLQRRKGAQSAQLADVQCNHAAAPK